MVLDATEIRVWQCWRSGGKMEGTARDGGEMLDPETGRAWRRLQREVKENVPIVLRGLVGSAKRMPRKFYSAAIRGCKSLTRRAKEMDVHFGGRKALVAQLSRVRLRSPIYKV